MEIQARGFTSELRKAELDIGQSAQQLSKAVEAFNGQMQEEDQTKIPDPIKLIRRLTALELAMSHLKNDCEYISRKRTEIVSTVLATQRQNVAQVQEMLDRTENADPYSSRDDMEDESWNRMKMALDKQNNLLSSLRSP